MTTPRSLEQLQIDEPCHEAWEAMDLADGGKRFCRRCAKHVYDLSKMSRGDATSLVNGGTSVCVRMTRVGDAVLTRDATGSQGRRTWLRRALAIAATLSIGSLFNVGCGRRAMVQGSPVPANPPPGRTQTMGIVAEPIVGKPAPTTIQGDVGPTTRTVKQGEAAIGSVVMPIDH